MPRRGPATRHRLLAGALACALGACARPAIEAAAPTDPERLLAQALSAWPARADAARLDGTLEVLRRAARLSPGAVAVELALARAEAFRALGAEPAEARAAHDASARAAERALRTLSPPFAAAVDAGRPAAEASALVEVSGAEALYWLALGRMGAAQATGHAAVLAVREPALALMERAAALDERLDAGGPLRALGAWAAQLPAAAGGGVAAARTRFARAAELFPGEPWRRVLEASTLCVLTQDAAAFDRLLAEVLAATPELDPARAPELRLAQRRARALLDKRSHLF